MKLDLSAGRMLWAFDPQPESLGDVLFLIVEPPIVCETCKKTIYDFQPDENGEWLCPHCGNEVKEFNHLICRRCGEDDLISYIVAANNNFGAWSDGTVTSYNHMVNKTYTICRKVLEDDLAHGRIRLLSRQEEIYRKRLLEWTASDQYEEGKPMPEWVLNLYPDPEK